MTRISKPYLAITTVGIALSIAVSPAAAAQNNSLLAWNDLEV